jgi:hypothetical protein
LEIAALHHIVGHFVAFAPHQSALHPLLDLFLFRPHLLIFEVLNGNFQSGKLPKVGLLGHLVLSIIAHEHFGLSIVLVLLDDLLEFVFEFLPNLPPDELSEGSLENCASFFAEGNCRCVDLST